jgi:preprotein translocase subunit SecY
MISFNPVEVANNIKNNGGAIPGIRVGRPTVEYIKKILYRITLVGALLIVFIACFPMLLNNILSIDAIEKAITDSGRTYNEYLQIFSTLAFGGSSLMIVVGVALETVRELEAQMTLRNYKGFLD